MFCMHNNVIHTVISTPYLLKGQHLTRNSNEYMNSAAEESKLPIFSSGAFHGNLCHAATLHAHGIRECSQSNLSHHLTTAEFFLAICFYSMPLTTWQTTSFGEEQNLAQWDVVGCVPPLFFKNLIKNTRRNKYKKWREKKHILTLLCTAQLPSAFYSEGLGLQF